MTSAVNELKTSVNDRLIAIGIYRDKKTWTVRKSEIIHGVRVPIDQVENLTSDQAIEQQEIWWKEFNCLPLN